MNADVPGNDISRGKRVNERQVTSNALFVILLI